MLLTEIVPDFEADTSLGKPDVLVAKNPFMRSLVRTKLRGLLRRPHQVSRLHRWIMGHPLQPPCGLHTRLHH